MAASALDPRRFLRHVLLALRQFTRIPAGEPHAADASSRHAAAVHYPAAGLVLGLAACVVFALASIVLPEAPGAALAAALASLAVGALLTGAAHEDGLAHVAEALAGDPRQAATALDDPRLGTYGVLALLFAVAGKAALVAALAQTSAAAVMAVLLAAPVVSRFWPLLLARELPLAGDEDAAAARVPLVKLGRLELQLAAMWGVVPLVLLALAGGLGLVVLAVAGSGLGYLLVRAWLRARLPLACGDTLGAGQQVAELGFLFFAAVSVGS